MRRTLSAVKRVLTPHRAALSNLMSMPLTLCGAGCVDAAAFLGNTIAGLVVTGVSLVLIEHLIADE